PLHGIIIFTGIIHSPTTSCLHFVCVCNKSDLIGTLASVIVLTGQTCGDCHLFQVHQHIVLLGFIPSLSPYFIVCVRERESVCEREGECVCVCVFVFVCVSERERKREREGKGERVSWVCRVCGGA